MNESIRIPFNHVAELPVPCEWMIKPDIKTMPLRYSKTKKKGNVYVIDEDDNKSITAYSFRFNSNSEALKRNVWRNWHAIGWNDCEVGHAWISATYYDYDDPDFEGVSSRVTWFVEFTHDGTPERYKGDPNGEFWGWIIEDVSVMHAYERTPRDKTPVTYKYTCKDLTGEKIQFEMTGNGSYDCEKKAEKKVDEDPNLRKMHIKGEPTNWGRKGSLTHWDEDHYFGGYCYVNKEVAA